MRNGVAKYRNMWRADFSANGEYRHVGIYPTREMAEAAFKEAELGFLVALREGRIKPAQRK